MGLIIIAAENNKVRKESIMIFFIISRYSIDLYKPFANLDLCIVIGKNDIQFSMKLMSENVKAFEP